MKYSINSINLEKKNDIRQREQESQEGEDSTERRLGGFSTQCDRILR